MFNIIVWVLGIIAVVYSIALLSDLVRTVERIEKKLDSNLQKLIDAVERK